MPNQSGSTPDQENAPVFQVGDHVVANIPNGETPERWEMVTQLDPHKTYVVIHTGITPPEWQEGKEPVIEIEGESGEIFDGFFHPLLFRKK